jgi:hypothetical protein
VLLVELEGIAPSSITTLLSFIEFYVDIILHFNTVVKNFFIGIGVMGLHHQL